MKERRPLWIDGAEFWLSDEAPEHGNVGPESLGGGSVKLLLTVPDPDSLFEWAIAAGAREVSAVQESTRAGWAPENRQPTTATPVFARTADKNAA